MPPSKFAGIKQAKACRQPILCQIFRSNICLVTFLIELQLVSYSVFSRKELR